MVPSRPQGSSFPAFPQFLLRGELPFPRGVRPARLDDVDADAVGGQLLGDGRRHVVDPALAVLYGTEVSIGMKESTELMKRMWASLGLLDHAASRVLRGVERPHERHLEGAPHRLEGELEKRLPLGVVGSCRSPCRGGPGPDAGTHWSRPAPSSAHRARVGGELPGVRGSQARYGVSSTVRASRWRAARSRG